MKYFNCGKHCENPICINKQILLTIGTEFVMGGEGEMYRDNFDNMHMFKVFPLYLPRP